VDANITITLKDREVKYDLIQERVMQVIPNQEERRKKYHENNMSVKYFTDI